MRAEIPFDYILDRGTGSDPSVTDYVLEVPVRCLQCGASITEKTRVEPGSAAVEWDFSGLSLAFIGNPRRIPVEVTHLGAGIAWLSTALSLCHAMDDGPGSFMTIWDSAEPSRFYQSQFDIESCLFAHRLVCGSVVLSVEYVR